MMNTRFGFSGLPLLIIVLVAVWTLFWKSYAVWTAAKKNHKIWFIAVLVFNTFGILEIIYLFAVAKKKWSDVKKVFFSIVLPKKTSKEHKEEK